MPSVLSVHRRLPLEVRLEVFGFLSHADWIRLAAHNRRTFKVLFGNLRYLAPLSRLHSVQFVRLYFIYFQLYQFI
jgi:hypothetical protein